VAALAVARAAEAAREAEVAAAAAERATARAAAALSAAGDAAPAADRVAKAAAENLDCVGADLIMRTAEIRDELEEAARSANTLLRVWSDQPMQTSEALRRAGARCTGLARRVRRIDALLDDYVAAAQAAGRRSRPL
jgi:hypothetical protein